MFKKILVFALFGAALAATVPADAQAQDGDIVAVAQATNGVIHVIDQVILPEM